jgi:hypothetical protein
VRPHDRTDVSIRDDQRDRLFVSCAGHLRAVCEVCASAYRLDQLAADVLALPRRHFLCPLCRSDLAGEVIEHMRTCRVFNGDRP